VLCITALTLLLLYICIDLFVVVALKHWLNQNNKDGNRSSKPANSRATKAEIG
jgi:hypothetical protein